MSFHLAAKFPLRKTRLVVFDPLLSLLLGLHSCLVCPQAPFPSSSTHLAIRRYLINITESSQDLSKAVRESRYFHAANQGQHAQQGAGGRGGEEGRAAGGASGNDKREETTAAAAVPQLRRNVHSDTTGLAMRRVENQQPHRPRRIKRTRGNDPSGACRTARPPGAAEKIKMCLRFLLTKKCL